MTEIFNHWQFFEIGLPSVNLFSIMLGMVFAFFQQGLFGKNIGKYIIIYFACLAGWYAGGLYLERNHNTETTQTTIRNK
jgi:hypothetical protein